MGDLRVRFPEDVKAWLEGEAKRNERSQNSQILWVLRQAMAASAAEPQREETGASVDQNLGAHLPHDPGANQ